MALPVAHNITPGAVPKDTFGARLAIVRQALGGWNVKKAAELCGLDDQTWRNWEAGKNPPRDMEGVCRSIAKATGFSYEWLMVGGSLSASGYKSAILEALEGSSDEMQLEFSYFRPSLSVVS
jgi:hypothetical protein